MKNKKQNLFGIIILMFTFTSCSSYQTNRTVIDTKLYERLIKENDSLRKEVFKLKTDINY